MKRSEKSQFSLVRLKEGDSADGAIVTLVHAVSGQLFCYRPLVNRLPSSYRVVGINSTFSGDEIGVAVERLAVCYWSELRTIHNATSFLLAGWSFGGLVAYEMARQAARTATRHDRLSVVMIDTRLRAPTTKARFRSKNEPLMFSRFVKHMGRSVGCWSAERGELPGQIHCCGQLAAALWENARVRVAPATLERLYRVFSANVKAQHTYRPNCSGIAGYYIRAQLEPHVEHSASAAGLSDNIKTIDVGADHHNILREPAVQQVARVIMQLHSQVGEIA